MRRKQLTLVIIHETNRILLGLKKRGLGIGKWNGFGGKVEPGETILTAAHRELEEECGITVPELKKVGLLEFEFVGDDELLEVHVFTSSEYKGEPFESDEMKPQWFKLEDIPYGKMWADDQMWLPLLLKGSLFKGYFVFQGHESMLSHNLQEVNNLQDITV